jgi:hypothetical protein
VKPELKYGLYGGAAMIGWTLGEFALGIHQTRFALGKFTGWGSEIILLVMVWRLLRLKFARLNRYWLPAWEGMLCGALASVVAGLVFYIFLNAYVNFINPEWPDLYLEFQVAQMRIAGDSELAIRAFVRSFRWMTGPVGLATLTIGLYTLLGAAFSAFLTLWLNLRHKEPPLAS